MKLLVSRRPLSETMATGVAALTRWIATSTLAGLVAGLLACLLPKSVGERLSPVLAWAAPAIGVLVLAYILRNYFLH